MKEHTQSCTDCLYCKVSAQSTDTIRLCYCAKEEKRPQPLELFWQGKAVCGNFDSMGESGAPSRRVPLLKGVIFLGSLRRC
jgi:hypothetical protein